MYTVRYLLPLGIFLLGCALLIIDGGGKTGWEGFFMATGAALSVLLLNWLFRLGASGDRERDWPRRPRASTWREPGTGRTRSERAGARARSRRARDHDPTATYAPLRSVAAESRPAAAVAHSSASHRQAASATWTQTSSAGSSS